MCGGRSSRTRAAQGTGSVLLTMQSIYKCDHVADDAVVANDWVYRAGVGPERCAWSYRLYKTHTFMHTSYVCILYMGRYTICMYTYVCVCIYM